MKLLFDFFPIILFFISYKFYDIYVATAVVIAVSFLQVFVYWLKYRRIDRMLIITCALVTILGGITLVLHNEIFIKWKPTVIYWLFAVAFLGSQYLCQTSLIKRMLESNISLPEPIWKRLNYGWVCFFFTMGLTNLIVVYNFSTDVWVNFKLIGIVGLTILFVILQAIYLARHIEPDEQTAQPTPATKEE